MLRAVAAGEVTGIDQAAQILNRGAMQRTRAADGFEAVELAGIMAAGDHDGAIGLEVHSGKMQERRTEPAIAAQADTRSAMAQQVCAQPAAEVGYVSTQ